MSLPLSLVIITLNESRNIKRCIESVPFADEVIVADSFSTDDTVDIARALGAKVVQEKWRGFGPMKAFAVGLAKNDWVLCLDADEALSPELAQEIQDRFHKLKENTGYQLPRLSFHLGKWIRHGGWYPDYQLRLFNRKIANWNQAEVHEKVEIKTTERLNSSIYHYVFAGISDQVKANDRYSSLQAQDYLKQGGKFSWFKFLTKPTSKFVECYFIKRGFLDGFAGFVIAVGAAYSVFIRWVKIWELSQEGAVRDV